MHIQRVQLRVIADFKNAIKQARIYLFNAHTHTHTKTDSTQNHRTNRIKISLKRGKLQEMCIKINYTPSSSSSFFYALLSASCAVFLLMKN